MVIIPHFLRLVGILSAGLIISEATNGAKVRSLSDATNPPKL